MHPLPRLPPTRPPARNRSLSQHSLPPLHRLHNRARRSEASVSSRSLQQSAPCFAIRYRHAYAHNRRKEEIQHHMEAGRLVTHSEFDVLLGAYELYCLLPYSSPVDWYYGRSPCDHSLAQNRLLCLHKPRPATRLPPPLIPNRRSRSRDLRFLSISEEHNTQQPVLLLVGSDPNLSTRLSSHRQSSMVLHLQTRP